MSNKLRLILSRLPRFRKNRTISIGSTTTIDTEAEIQENLESTIEINGILYSPRLVSINSLATQFNTIELQRDSISIFQNQQLIYDLIVNIYPDFNVSLAQFHTISTALSVLHGKLVYVINMFVPFFRNTRRQDILSKIIELLECYRDNSSWNVAHFAAYFNHIDYFLNVSIEELEDHKNPDQWSPLHIAVLMSNMFVVCLMLKSGMDVYLVDSKQWTVMHFAMLAAPQVLSTLLSMPAFYQQLRHLDQNGMTPLHVACLANNVKHIQSVMAQGITACQLMIKTPKPSPEISLVELYQDYSPYVPFDSKEINEDFNWQSIIYYGNPLHWCQSWTMLNRLLDMRVFEVNQRNSLGDTPLMTFTNTPPNHIKTSSPESFDQPVMVNFRLSWMLRLITAGARMNACNEQGNTALHYAVLNGFVVTVQLLIIFGSRINIRNKENYSALHLAAMKLNQFQMKIKSKVKFSKPSSSHRQIPTRLDQKKRVVYEKIISFLHSVGAKRCPKNLNGCTSDCFYIGDVIQQKSDSDSLFCVELNTVNNSAQNFRLQLPNLLVLDGGLNDSFINPLIQIILLNELQRNLKHPLQDYFDIISGTSFGFITGCSLANGRKLFETFNFFLKLKSNFKKPMIRMQDQNTDRLEHELKVVFSDSKTLKDVRRQFNKHLILTTTVVDGKPSRLKLIDDGIEDLTLWKACRISGAGAGLFKTIEHEGVPYFDGSFTASNPTIDVLAFYHNSMLNKHQYISVENIQNGLLKLLPAYFVLSIGSGKMPYQNNISPIDLTTFKPYMTNLKEYFKYFRQLRDWFVSILMETDSYVVQRSKYFVTSQQISFGRINTFYDKKQAKRNLEELDKIVGPYWDYPNYYLPHQIESFQQMRSEQLLLQILWDVKVQSYENRSHFQKVAKFLQSKYLKTNSKLKFSQLTKNKTQSFQLDLKKQNDSFIHRVK